MSLDQTMHSHKGGYRVRDLLRRFWRDAAANIAMMAAIAMPAVIISVGSAIDLGHTEMVHTRLTDAADAAALAQISASVASRTPNGYNNSAALQQVGLNFFNANTTSLGGVTITSLTSNVSVANSVATSTINYTAAVPTFMAGFFGVRSVNVSGKSSSQITIPSYIDFYLMLDNSMSMGVGATPADMANLQAHTPDQCAFACHDLSNSNSYYSIAKSIGMTMRIDVLRLSVQKLMSTALQSEKLPSQFRVAIYSFGNTGVPVEGLNNIQPLTSDLASAATSLPLQNLDIMTMYGQNISNTLQTQYDILFPQMGGVIPTGGDGSSQKPNKVLFFVSDGVTDELNMANCQGTSSGGVCQGPIDPALCNKIKSSGVNIAVLYTTYLPIPNNQQYVNWIQNFNAGPWGPSPNSQIAKNMQACASPGLFFEVSPTQGISDAMAQLFLKAVAVERITS